MTHKLVTDGIPDIAGRYRSHYIIMAIEVIRGTTTPATPLDVQ